ncbi:MAG: hypothetical protein ACREIW_07710 [Chthoniobacterales bacterium]
MTVRIKHSDPIRCPLAWARSDKLIHKSTWPALSEIDAQRADFVGEDGLIFRESVADYDPVENPKAAKEE